MTAQKIDRVSVLCEDNLHKRFLMRWLEHRGIKLLDADVAPSAKGSGSAYVKNRFQLFVKKAKQKANQAGLGFIVVLDGDAAGLVAQKTVLEKLIAGDVTLQFTFENRIAALIPTWSLDTWILAICGAEIAESTQITDEIKRSIDDAKIRQAAAYFDAYRQATPAHLPAMIDAQLELNKLDLA